MGPAAPVRTTPDGRIPVTPETPRKRKSGAGKKRSAKKNKAKGRPAAKKAAKRAGAAGKPAKKRPAKRSSGGRSPHAASDALDAVPPGGAGASGEAPSPGAPRARSLRRGKRRSATHVIPERLEPKQKPVKKVRPTKRGKRPAKKRTAGRRKPIAVGGHKVPKGTADNIMLKVSEHYTHQGVYIPVTIIRGARPGPRLYLTAAVHGDEINGVQIIRELIDHVTPDKLRGTLVAVPVVNRFGFASHSRYMPDRRDLNRHFPGEPNGSTTGRMAHVVFEEIVRPCDYGIDLHTAGYQRHNLPQIRGDMDDDEVRRIAKAFGAEVILDTRGSKGTLRRAATEAGVPTIIYEAGETYRFQRGVISKGVTGILNVMRELYMLRGAQERPAYQVIVKTSEWVRADHGGIMEVLVDAGDLVYKGEEIAHIANPFGRTVDSVRAPFDGLVVGITMLPLVNPGAPVCHLVKLKKTLNTVARHSGRVRVDRLDQEDIDQEPPGAALEEEDVEG